jgi:diguanylate cyclase (GGDEF)-like protein
MMSKTANINKKEKEPAKAKIYINSSKLSVLGLRWVLSIFMLMFYLSRHNIKPIATAFFVTFFAAVIYNTLVSSYALKREKVRNEVNVLFLFIDVLFLSFFSYLLGGVNSGVFSMYFFVFVYCGVMKGQGIIIQMTVFTVLTYTVSSVYSAKLFEEGIEYINLIVKDLLLIMAGLSIVRINSEVNKYDQLHKKEFRLARTDKLTGLANRHYFDQYIAEETKYVEETGNPLNILMFDIDNFKDFNDTYGHLRGDQLLVLFSKIIRENIRENDMAIRYGGEEFIVLIRDLDITIARSIAERIRRQLERHRIYILRGDQRQKVTVSCGIAQLSRDLNMHQAIEMADKALYRAKSAGKNTIAVFSENYKN